MRKIFLINFSLMEKIADKKNGITAEEATAYITGVEMFFIGLIAEFLIVKILPFKVPNIILFGVMAVIWYYTHYILRKSLKKIIVNAGIRKVYGTLSKSKQKNYLMLSILLFFVFFAAGVMTIGGYDKRWQ